MSIEIKVTIKNEEKKLSKDFNLYDVVTLHEGDPILSQCIKEVKNEFIGEIDHIIINAKMIL